MDIVGERSPVELERGEQQSHLIDYEVEHWLSDSDEVVWSDESLMVGGIVEKHILAVDRNRECVRLFRSWVPYQHLDEVFAAAISKESVSFDHKPAQVSIDLDKSFEQMCCPPQDIDEMSFPHSDARLGILGQHHEGIFLDQFGGDVRFLWKNDQVGRTAFLGRVARIGNEEALFGASITHTAGNPKITIGFEMPLSEIFPSRRSRYSR